MFNCYHCENPRDCLGKDWFSWGEIRYCRFQVIWVLKHLGELLTGFWPERPLTEEEEKNRPKTPGLGRLPSMGGVYGNASFERAICVVADVESRIDKTGKDGDILRAFYCQGYTDITELAREMSEPVEKIERAIKNSLRYVTGQRVRRHRDKTEITYREFLDGHKLPDLGNPPICTNKSKLVSKA